MFSRKKILRWLMWVVSVVVVLSGLTLDLMQTRPVRASP